MNNSKNMNVEKDNNKKKRLLPMAVIVLGVFLFLVALFINHRMSVNVSEAKAIPKIEGQTELVLNEGYDETETSAYTVQGGTVSIVSDTTGGKAVWNEETSKLLIQTGLTSNASVTLEVSNGNAVENATITLYITITHNPCIKGPKECFLEDGYKTSQSGVFAVYGKNVSVSITDESKTGLVTWNDEERKLDIAPGLKLGTYKIILTASNGNTELDSVWECVITVGKKCTVTGSYAYSSGTYLKGALVNIKDKVTVKIGDYVAEVNTTTRTYECLVPNGYYDVVFSSELFEEVKFANVHITNNTKLDKALFDVPTLTPTQFFGYNERGNDGNHYGVWLDRAVSAIGMSADEGFTATVSMRPSDDWGLDSRGIVGVQVGEKAFYIIPRYDANKNISLYVSEQLVDTADVRLTDWQSQHLLGDTGQTYNGGTNDYLVCTMQLTYLNGNYYISLKADGCDAEPNLLVLNQSTSGLSAEYFGNGTRTVLLASFKNRMNRYRDFSYAMGNKAAQAVVGDVELCTITGTYSYASGTYTNGGYKNADDKVQVKIGPYMITPNTNSQTYKVVVPKGNYDVTLSSNQFCDVTFAGVQAAGTKTLQNAEFNVPKLTPTNYFGYNSRENDGNHYGVWLDRAVSAVGMKANAGFTATVSMRPSDDWGLDSRGIVGVQVGEKAFYIIPRYDADKNISLYVSEQLVDTADLRLADWQSQHFLGDTGQTYSGGTNDYAVCTMGLTYLKGNYYVSLKADGCDAEPNLLVLNQTTSGLGEEYFGTGTRTVLLASFKNRMNRYRDFSYAIGNEAAQAAVGNVELCTVTGSYSYTSGTYTTAGYKNAGDKVQVKIGPYMITPDANSQTYKVVVPKGTYDVTLSSNQFCDVTFAGVQATGTKTLQNAEFNVPKLTPTDYFGYNSRENDGNHYGVWLNRAVSAVGMEADEGFTATVSMRPSDDWGLDSRGIVGVRVGHKEFYIIPRYDANMNISLYVSDKLVDTADLRLADWQRQHFLGDTGQTYSGGTNNYSVCTMQLTYLDGNYYVSLKAEGCDAEPNLLVLNQTTSGLGEEYFGNGTRTVLLASFKNRMNRYRDFSYAIGNEAAQTAVGNIELSTITGSYSYASGTYTTAGCRNIDDKVQVKIGPYMITPDANAQTYEAVIPKGSYDVALSSNYFKDVKVVGVDAQAATTVPLATFTVPKVTPANDCGERDNGTGYAPWKGKAISPIGLKTDEGFTATVTMKAAANDYGTEGLGSVGVKVGDKTFYIIPVRDYSGDNAIYLYVSEQIEKVSNYRNATWKANHLLGSTGQIYPIDNGVYVPCTMTLTYLEGNYYVSLKADGCTAEPKVLQLNQQSGLLGAEYFGTGTRSIQLASFTDHFLSYGNISYKLGNAAAQEILYDKGFVKVTGTYSYASGTYKEGALTNVDDTISVKFGVYGATVDTKTQTYEAVVPKDTYNVTLSSKYFKDVEIASVEVQNEMNVPAVTFSVPKVTPTGDYGDRDNGTGYAPWKGKAISPVGLKTDEGFTATVTMKAAANDYGTEGLGSVGVKVGDKTFYIIPVRDYSGDNTIYLYVSEQIEKVSNYRNATWKANHLLGSTGQIYPIENGVYVPCTMTLTYLNGNYYVSLKAEGCAAEPKTLLLNQQTSGLGAEYFGAGTRSIQLASFTDHFLCYGNISYKLGNVAAEEVLDAAGYRKITGTVRYQAGIYDTDVLKQDKITVKIGNYTVNVKSTSEIMAETLKQALEGKYVSILGDSLSTYAGVSNSGSPNTTTAGYNSYYGVDNKLTDWTQTYWGQIIEKYDMKLLVNNSCGGNRLVDTSGTGVSAPAGYLRAGELAANTGNLNGQVPDVIFMHMGTNDYIGKVDRQRFKTAYETSLNTINEKYPDAQVYCFTLTPSHYNTDYDMLVEFNEVIRSVVSAYDNVTLVDVAAESSITADNYVSDYTIDGTHYNAAGISQVVTVLEHALTERNCNQPFISYEAMVDEDTYDITISSNYFEDVTISNVKVEGNTTVPEVQLTEKKVTKKVSSSENFFTTAVTTVRQFIAQRKSN